MDQNQNTGDKTAANRLNNSTGNISAHGSGDKHNAKLRTAPYRESFSSASTRLSSPKRLHPEEYARLLAKYVGNSTSHSCSMRAVSSVSNNVFEQYSKTQNSQMRKRSSKTKQLKQNGLYGATGPVPGSSTGGERKVSMPVPDLKLVCETNNGRKEVDGNISAEWSAEEKAMSKLYSDKKNDNNYTSGIEDLQATASESWGGADIPQQACVQNPVVIQVEEPSTFSFPEQQPLAQHFNHNEFHRHDLQPQQPNHMQYTCPTSGNFDFESFFNLNSMGSNNVGNCFSCANVNRTRTGHCDFLNHGYSEYNLNSRNCASADQFHCPFSWNKSSNSESEYNNANHNEFQNNEPPNISVQNNGKCVINSACQMASDDGRFFNIHGFKVSFYQRDDQPNANYEGSIRIDFSTLGFLDPEYFETQVDDEGNIFVLGNIYGTMSKLWISVPHCRNPDKVYVESPFPYYYTIEIPCESHVRAEQCE